MSAIPSLWARHRPGVPRCLRGSAVHSLFLFLSVFLCVFAPLRETSLPASSAMATELAVRETRFTIDGKPTFLLGISYYGALGASPETVRKDLDDIERLGFNWIRVWATWSGFGNPVSAVDSDGKPREPFFSRLRELLADCDRRGMIVDVTLSRGNGVAGAPRLLTLA